MPSDTDLGQLAPGDRSLRICHGGTRQRGSGRFSGGPVIYTVTAQDGVTQTFYLVSVEVAPSDCTTLPVALCQDVNVQLDGSGIATLLASQFDGGSSGGCGPVTLGVRSLPVRNFDQAVTPEAIFGSGNTNGSYTVSQGAEVELGLRAKVRYPAPENTFNSNGDGTYSHLAGNGSPATRALWNFEWSINTDPAGTSGAALDDLSYEFGIDFDPGQGTNFLVFDPVNQPFADHALGDNATGNGGGQVAADPAQYTGLISSLNVAQNSWNMDFFDEAPFDGFDPAADGTYTIYLKAFGPGGQLLVSYPDRCNRRGRRGFGWLARIRGIHNRGYRYASGATLCHRRRGQPGYLFVKCYCARRRTTCYGPY